MCSARHRLAAVRAATGNCQDRPGESGGDRAVSSPGSLNLTRNVKRMLSAGWIEEVQVGERGRARRIAVTKVGRRLLQEAAPAWRSAQRRTKAKLGDGMDVVADTANGLMKEHATA